MVDRQVLVVDDEAGVRTLLRRWIEAEGWSVREAESAESAIDRLEEGAAQVAFCDVQMGGQDGLWLTRQIRARYPSTAVVLATGVSSVPAEISMQAGVMAYLVKPFERAQVRHALSLVEQWTESSADRQRPQHVDLDDWLDTLERHLR